MMRANVNRMCVTIRGSKAFERDRTDDNGDDTALVATESQWGLRLIRGEANEFKQFGNPNSNYYLRLANWIVETGLIDTLV